MFRQLFFILFLAFCFGVKNPNTRHIMGVEISWDYLGNDSFLLIAYVYRNCHALNLTTIAHTVKNNQGNSLNINAYLSKRRDIKPVCNGQSSRFKDPRSTIYYGAEYYTFTQMVLLNSFKTLNNSTITISLINYICCNDHSLPKTNFPFMKSYKKVGEYKPFLLEKLNMKTCTNTQDSSSSIHAFPTRISNPQNVYQFTIYPNPENNFLCSSIYLTLSICNILIINWLSTIINI